MSLLHLDPTKQRAPVWRGNYGNWVSTPPR